MSKRKAPRPAADDSDDEPEIEYYDEETPCHHGIWPRHECQWCKDEFEE